MISTVVVIASLAIANIVGASLFVAILVRPVEQSEGETRWGNRAGPSVVDPPPERPEVVEADRSRRWSVRIGPLDARIEAEPDPATTEPRRPRAPRDRAPRAQTARVGATIGILERILIVVFVLTGSEAAIGFVVAAKTLARFRLLDDRDFAEYYLLGTLGSVAVAIVTAWSDGPPWSRCWPEPRRQSSRTRARSDAQRRQPLRGGSQRVEPLREREPELRPAQLRSREERRAGHGRHSRIGDQAAGERDVVLVGQVADVGHHVVGAVRAMDAEPGRLERRHEDVAPLAVVGEQALVVRVRHQEARDRRGLERRGGADGQEVVDPADPIVRSGGAITQPTRQPVTEYVFDIESIAIVRSRIPGSVASGMCSPA